MRKITSLFKRDYQGNRQVFNEVVPGAEWVLAGEGIATQKHDGTCCLVRDGRAEAEESLRYYQERSAAGQKKPQRLPAARLLPKP